MGVQVVGRDEPIINIEMQRRGITKAYGFGWKKDPSDERDWEYAPPGVGPLPEKVDLRPGCPPVYNQRSLDSCSANAIAAAVEFNLLKETGKRAFIPSRLFLFYNSRAIEHTEKEDTGVYIRDAIKAVARHGDCPEELWPYVEHNYPERPPTKCYESAMKYKVIEYYRLHRRLVDMRACLSSGYPFVFGFTAHEKFREEVKRTGRLEMPARRETVIGKHAVLAVGYDHGARRLIVRNSWGSKFGLDGYFTMPYGYVQKDDLSADFWTIRVVSQRVASRHPPRHGLPLPRGATRTSGRLARS